MQTSDLSRVQNRQVGPLGGAASRALFLMLTIGLLIAAWQAVLPSREQTASAPGPAMAAADAQAGEQNLRSAVPPQPPSPFRGTETGSIVPNKDPTPAAAAVDIRPDRAEAAASFPTGSDGDPVTVASVSERPSPATEAVQVGEPAPPPALSQPALASADAGVAVGPDRSGGLLDLNTATLAQLNALRGGGLIGRAIIRGRPYAAAEDLVRRRVLSRATYDRIKDQVTIRTARAQ